MTTSAASLATMENRPKTAPFRLFKSTGSNCDLGRCVMFPAVSASAGLLMSKSENFGFASIKESKPLPFGLFYKKLKWERAA